MTKIAFIGANSVEFVRGDVIDLCGMPELGELRLALHDPNSLRLEHAGSVARAIARQTRGRVTVEVCPERVKALDGASYVVSELEVGGISATRTDFAVASRYGLRQSVGDTIGIGGIMRGLRTLPVVIGIAREMADRCPDAYLLTYTNPMVMSVWAAYAATPLRRIYGLCHCVQETHELLAALVDVDPAEAEFVSAGLNHQAFVLRFARGGESLYPRLAEAIERRPDRVHPVAAELFRRFGLFPTHPMAEYLPWIMRHPEEIDRFQVTLDEHEPGEAQTQREMATDRHRVATGVPFDLTPTGSLAARFVHALETGRSRELYVSVRNDGLVANLPADCPVEVPCRIEAGRATPVAVGQLPPQIAALNRTFLNVAELTVQAVLTGDRRYVHQAALLDPNTAATLTTSRIAALCDDLLAAHGDLLPPGLTR